MSALWLFAIAGASCFIHGQAESFALVSTTLVRAGQAVLVLAGALTIVLVLLEPEESRRGGAGDRLLLLIGAVVGLTLLVGTHHLLLWYVGLELATLPVIALAASHEESNRSSEAAVKLAIFASLASGMILYGLSLLVMSNGGALHLATGSPPTAWGDHLRVLGLGLVTAGVGFKIALAPFHLWAPDVYQGSPTPIAAFLSVGSKGGGLLALFALYQTFGLTVTGDALRTLVVLTAAVTMTWGNIGAIGTRNIKRLLGYSSVSQAGYLLLAFLSPGEHAKALLTFYLCVYLVSNFGAFFVVHTLERAHQNNAISSFRGLARRSPLLALVMVCSVLSLAGVPPFPGFFGKFWLFSIPAQQGMYLLVLVASVNSVVSLYYYLTVAREMYMEESRSPGELTLALGERVFAGLFLVALAVVAIYPGLLEGLLRAAS